MEDDNLINSMISVIVPIYKVEAYLRKCVDSILAQTYKNLEIILVDDGSPDNCPAICDEYAKKDSRVVVIHKENGGPGSARNAGLDICRGEYIGFVDGDDRIEPDMYRDMLRTMLENDCDIVACKWFRNGHEGIFTPKPSGVVLDNHWIFEAHAKSSVMMVVLWNKLYKRKIWDGLRMPDMKKHEDIYMRLDIMLRCDRAYIVDKYYYHYVKRDDSACNAGFDEENLNIIDVSRRESDYYRENLPELYTYVALSAAHSIVRCMTAIIYRHVYFKYRKIYKRLKNELKKEYEAAKPYITEKTKNVSRVETVVNHPTKFFIKNFLQGIKNKIKGK